MTRRRDRSSPQAAELRDQVRTDIRESAARAAEELTDVPAGHVVLATPHVATIVRLADIAEVAVVPVNSLGLRGCVTLHDGTRYFVPEAADVLRAMREARA
jgi:hypothetical protein